MKYAVLAFCFIFGSVLLAMSRPFGMHLWMVFISSLALGFLGLVYAARYGSDTIFRL